MSETEVYTPFFVDGDNVDTGPRLGGSSPKAVMPQHQSDLTKYLMTIPVTQDLEASIFTSFDYENDGEANPFDMCGVLFDERNPLVEVVFHSPCERDSSAPIPSDLPGHKLSSISGDVSEVGSELGEFHKFGGDPVFRHDNDPEFVATCQELLSSDYRQVVQLAFPVGPYDAVIDADWPFGEYIFHLFVTFKDGSPHYKYCWG